jgi:hypothetical protein
MNEKATSKQKRMNREEVNMNRHLLREINQKKKDDL